MKPLDFAKAVLADPTEYEHDVVDLARLALAGWKAKFRGRVKAVESLLARTTEDVTPRPRANGDDD